MKQRTQLGNAIRGHLAGYGWVAPEGATHLAMLVDLLEGGGIGGTLSETARPMFTMLVEMLAGLDERIAALDKEIARRARDPRTPVLKWAGDHWHRSTRQSEVQTRPSTCWRQGDQSGMSAYPRSWRLAKVVSAESLMTIPGVT